jgi:peptidoglycan/xylan/chitin deacetylase (PgdA/CDA1 family)
MELRPNSGVRALARWMWIYFLYCTGLLQRAHRAVTSRGLVILTLHRVLDEHHAASTRSPRGMVVRERTFEQLLAHLKQNYEVVSLNDRFSGNPVKPRIAITFDDGWEDTGTVAFPLSLKYQVPIAVFVCPGLIGKRAPFWPERVIGLLRSASLSPQRKAQFCNVCQLRSVQLEPSFRFQDEEKLVSELKKLHPGSLQQLLTDFDQLAAEWEAHISADPLESTLDWPALANLSAQGVTIGSHSQNHPILTRLAPTDITAELMLSKQEIDRRLGGHCKFFAYPNGSWSHQARELVRQSGFACAFINTPGIWTRHTDPWLIPRANVWEGSLIGPFGRFSNAVFLYSIFWRIYRCTPSPLATS